MKNGSKVPPRRAAHALRAVPTAVGICVALLCLAPRLALANPPYLHPSRVPTAISDPFCGAYAVWHVCYHFGRHIPITTLADELQITSKEGTTFARMVPVLERHGLSVEPVQLDPNNIRDIRHPFIPYIPSPVNEKVGHFLLCVPMTHGKAMVLNGDWGREIALASLEQESARTGWNGEAILIRGDASRRRGVFMVWAACAAAFVGAAAWSLLCLFQLSRGKEASSAIENR